MCKCLSLSHTPCASAWICSGPNGGPCTPCKQGSYKAQNGSLACASCPSHSHSPSASPHVTACVCNVGYTGDDGAECVACAAGKYKTNTGSAVCISCPPHAYSYNGSYLYTNCTCNAGWESMLPSGCAACARAHYKTSSGTHSCVPCPAGSFLNVTAGSACELCPPSSDSEAEQEECTCNAGYSGLPLASSTAGTLGEGCLFCPVGSYKATIGSHACLDCPSGSFSRDTAAVQCSVCPETFYDLYDIALPQCREDFFFACQV